MSEEQWAPDLKIEKLKTQIKRLKAENEEQARLLGISGSREAALLSEIASLKNEVKQLKTDHMCQWRLERDDWKSLALGAKGALDNIKESDSCGEEQCRYLAKRALDAFEKR